MSHLCSAPAPFLPPLCHGWDHPSVGIQPQTLGTGEVSQGIFHCPSRCFCGEQCWAGSASSTVPVGYKGLRVQHALGCGIAGDLVLCWDVTCPHLGHSC